MQHFEVCSPNTDTKIRPCPIISNRPRAYPGAMKTEQPLVRTSNASGVRSLKCDDNNLIRALSVVVLLATAGTSRVVGASADRLPAVSATASADDGNVPANALDGSLVTRWSAFGDGQWIFF